MNRNLTRRGSAIVEAAFVLSLLILLFVGILEMGRIFMTYSLLTYAVREGARLATLSPSLEPNDPDVVEQINRVLQEGGAMAAESEVAFTPPEQGGTLRGTMIRVSARTDLFPISAMVFGDTAAIPLRVQVTARHE